jgi:hypothetical protein
MVLGYKGIEVFRYWGIMVAGIIWRVEWIVQTVIRFER